MIRPSLLCWLLLAAAGPLQAQVSVHWGSGWRKMKGRQSRRPPMHLGGWSGDTNLDRFGQLAPAAMKRLGLTAKVENNGKTVVGRAAGSLALAFFLPLDRQRSHISAIAAGANA